MGSFSTPLSGLTAAQQQLQSVSNNLANIDTDGYKSQTLTFSDIFLQTGQVNGAGDPVQTGSGVQVSSTNSNYTEGNLNATNTSSNMAISGNGFFITQSANGLQNYTRAGDFTTNNAGQLTTPSGELLLGYPAVNGVPNKSATLQPLQVSAVTSPATASTTVGITVNLDADTTAQTVAPTVANTTTTSTYTYNLATDGTVDAGTTLSITSGGTPYTVTATAGESLSDYATALQAALPAGSGITVSATGNQLTVAGANTMAAPTGALMQDSATTAAQSSPITVYDSLGDQHTLTVSYTKTDTNTWNYSVTIPPADGAGAGGSATVSTGTLVFNSSGQLDAAASTLNPIKIASLTNGANTNGANGWTLTGPFGTAVKPTITQSAMASATSANTTDGFPAGTLSSYTVGADGTITGTFTGGNSMALGQVAVASFANNQGLTSVGNNNYQATAASGQAVIGEAGTGGRGAIKGGNVEQSNVDIATEFAKLIVAQQAYSANAKSITTFNTLSQATLAMIQ
jgi:flagellar hook protein FlgE